MTRLFILSVSILLSSLAYCQEDKDATITSLKEEIRNLVRINESLRAELSKLRAEAPSVSGNGEEYRVQLGVQNSVVPSLSTPKMMTGSMVNGKMVYDVAGFKNPNDAFNLSQELRKLNLGGAFVTRYVNGVRDYSFNYDQSNNSRSYSSYTPPASTRPAPSYNTESGTLNFGNQEPKKSASMYVEE